MKLNKFFLLALAGVALTACNDINEIQPAGRGITQEQVNKVYEALPQRAEASFSGMYSMMGEPYYTFGASERADDFGFITMAISNDAEGPDYFYPNSGYNWFSVCGEYTSRNADYANPYIRYASPYNQLKMANDIIKSYAGRTDEDAISHVAQCRAMRAFDYLSMAYAFQYKYVGHEEEPCVPIVTEETTEFANNPRATVKKVYEQIMDDLNYAVDNLTVQRSSKARINKTVALGLRARAYLAMEKWSEAAADADAALTLAKQEGLEAASIQDVSTPAFCDINEKNWIWGYDMTEAIANQEYATASSWLSSFSSNGYAAAVQVYACINNLLYDKISATDVRKGWWVDDNLHSPLLSTISWDGVTGDDISYYTVDDVKTVFLPGTNVKFGIPSGIGNPKNDSDYPFMRVEELILVKAEGLAKSGNEGEAKNVISDFVQKYRDPSYNIAMSPRSLADEIWFQRRVELWGEGFAMSDIMRLGKPVVRFHDDKSRVPAAYRFNIAPDDKVLLLHFCTSETNTNHAIVNNPAFNFPTMYQNPELRDGVTD